MTDRLLWGGLFLMGIVAVVCGPVGLCAALIFGAYDELPPFAVITACGVVLWRFGVWGLTNEVYP